MGRAERNRGASFEREVCQMVRAATIPGGPSVVVRRGKQSHLADEGDVVIEVGPDLLRRLWIECHSGATPAAVKLNQAEDDAMTWSRLGESRRLPVVIWRKKSAKGTRATMRLGTLIEIVDGAHVFTREHASATALVTMDAEDFFGLVVDRG